MAVVQWMRVENWSGTRNRYVELATDGAVLWIRKGEIRSGDRPVIERRVHASEADATAALATELKKLSRNRFVDERKQFAAEAPAGPTERDEPRPPTSEELALRDAFYARLRAAAIDPEVTFFEQARGETREKREREADARAGLALRLAKEVFGIKLALSWMQEHDEVTESERWPSAGAIFAHVRHLRRR